MCGIRVTTPTRATAEAAPTAQNAERQPRCSPRNAPSGTPSTLATERPPIITAIARARWFTGTIAMATAAPTAQKPAQASALTTREAKRISYVGASAPAIWPRPNTEISATRVVRRGSRSVATASSGAPTTMPIANADMRSPACGIDTFMSSAIGGSRPDSMNSLVPSAKTERPRTYTARGMGARREAESGMTRPNAGERFRIPRRRGKARPFTPLSHRPRAHSSRVTRAGRAASCREGRRRASRRWPPARRGGRRSCR